MDCDASISPRFWHSVKENYSEHDMPLFYSLIAFNELTICCLDHINVCLCPEGPISLEHAEEMLAQLDITDKDIWDDSCDNCVNRNTSTCIPYLEWIQKFLEEDSMNPEKLSICQHFELLDGYYEPSVLERN